MSIYALTKEKKRAMNLKERKEGGILEDLEGEKRREKYCKYKHTHPIYDKYINVMQNKHFKWI